MDEISNKIIPISNQYENQTYNDIIANEAPVLKLNIGRENVYRRVLDLYYEVIEKEPFISHCIDLRQKYITSLKIKIKEISNKEIEDFIYKILFENIDFSAFLIQVLSSQVYGFSIQEKLYEMRNGKWEMVGYQPIPPHTIAFKYNKETNAIDIVYNKNGFFYGNDVTNLSEYRNKFILYTYNPRFGNPYGQSLIDTGVYQLFLYKKEIKKAWYIAVQKYGKPIPYGEYVGTLSKEEQDVLIQKVADIGNGNATVFPQGDMLLNQLDIKRRDSSEMFENYWRTIDNESANRLLFTTMSAETDDVGSLARNEVYESVQQMCFYADGRNMVGTLNEELVKPEIIRNFGEQEEYPLLYIPDYEKDADTNKQGEDMDDSSSDSIDNSNSDNSNNNNTNTVVNSARSIIKFIKNIR